MKKNEINVKQKIRIFYGTMRTIGAIVIIKKKKKIFSKREKKRFLVNLKAEFSLRSESKR